MAVLDYRGRGKEPGVELTPEEQRRLMLRCVGFALVATVAWCVAMFWTGRPALDYFCVCSAIPLLLAGLWVTFGWQLLTVVRRYPQLRRRWLTMLIGVCFVMAPYVLTRAGADMFTLSVRYHVWRAGGADRVRAAFNQWVAAQPAVGQQSDEKYLFDRWTASGDLVRLPVSQMPAEVRYIHEHFRSRFGISWKGVAHLDNVSALTTTDIMIGPPGWEPDGPETVWSRITGSRRKVGDGIWIGFGVYDK